jgi:hypothetical protein
MRGSGASGTRKRPLAMMSVVLNTSPDKNVEAPRQSVPFDPAALALHGLKRAGDDEEGVPMYTMRGVTFCGRSAVEDTVPHCFRALFGRLEKNLSLSEYLVACAEVLESHESRLRQVRACAGAKAQNEEATLVKVGSFTLRYRLASRLPFQVLDAAGRTITRSPFLLFPLAEASKKV